MANGHKLPKFDPSKFSSEAFGMRIEKPWGYEIHWVPESCPYMGKIIHIEEGHRLSLQVHDQKSESWLLIKGEAAVVWENEKGEMIRTELEKGVGFTTQVGQKHRLVGHTSCDIIEVSTPEVGTTWRLEDDYDRPHETPEQRARERTNTTKNLSAKKTTSNADTTA